MSKRVVLIAFILFTSTPLHAQSQRQVGGIGLTVFADSDFRGASATFRDDVSNLQEVGLNDRISSLQVARGELWEVCEHANYLGRCQVFSGYEPDLRRIGWSDNISSVRRVRGGRGGGGGGMFPPQPSRRSIELFARPGFSGERRLFTDEVSNLQLEDFNDQAMSLRIGRAGNWQVCADANFRNCVVVTSDLADLSQLGMSRRISSFRPWSQGRGGGGPPDEIRLVLFEGRSFRGGAFTVERAMPNLGGFGSRVQSAQVIGGTWQLCSETAFRGRCVMVSDSEADLGNVGLNDGVRSARPRTMQFGR